MADTTNQPTTAGTTSSWTDWISAAKEIISAGTGIAKDVAGIKLTDAQRKAVDAQKAKPNWTMIGIVSAVGVFLIVLVILLISRARRRRA